MDQVLASHHTRARVLASRLHVLNFAGFLSR